MRNVRHTAVCTGLLLAFAGALAGSLQARTRLHQELSVPDTGPRTGPPERMRPDPLHHGQPDPAKRVLFDSTKPALPDSTKQVLPDSTKHALPDSTKHVLPDSTKRALPDSTKRALPDSTKRALPDSTKRALPDSTKHVLPDSLVYYSLPSLPGSLNHRMDSLDVVDHVALEWTSARTLNQVLSSRPGVFGNEPSSVGQYFPLTMRGAGLRSNTILVDGRPVADPASGIFNLSLFPMELAERVEIVTGPRSFLYGSQGAGGTVNIVTTTGAHRIPFTKIRYEEAGYNHGYSDGSFNQNLTRRSNLSFGYQYIGTDGRFLNSPHEQWNIHGALRYHLLPNVSIILSERYAQTHTGLNGGINYSVTGFQYSFDPRQARVFSTAAYEKLTRHDIDVRLLGMLMPDSTDLSSVTFYYSGNLREFRIEEPDSSRNIHEDHRSSWFGVRAEQSATLGTHHLSAGINAEVRQVEGSMALGRLQNPSVSAWAMDDAEITPGVNVAVYGRTETFRGEHSAGLGADASVILGDGLTLRGGVSFSRRAPTYAELFWRDTTVIRDGAISTESHRFAEAGLQWVRPGFGTVRLMVAQRTITNPVLTMAQNAYAPFPALLLRNGDRRHTLTAELSMQLRFFRYVLVEGTGTYMVREDGTGTARLEDYPQFWGEGGVYLAGTFLNEKLDLKAGVRSRITTRSTGYLFSPQSLFSLPNEIAPLGMGSTLDLLAVARIGSAYIHIMWENITSTRYFTSPFTPALDRTLRFGISWEFLN